MYPPSQINNNSNNNHTLQYTFQSVSSPTTSFSSHPSPINTTFTNHQPNTYYSNNTSTPLHSPGISPFPSQLNTFHPPYPPSPFTTYPPPTPSFASPTTYFPPQTHIQQHQIPQAYFPHTPSALATCTSPAISPPVTRSAQKSISGMSGKRAMQDRKESVESGHQDGNLSNKKKRISLSCAQCKSGSDGHS
jgi:hypothetical protein